MIIPGLVSATFKSLSTDDVLSVMDKAGLKVIEWSENHHIVAGNLAMAREIAEKTADKGIDIAGYGSYFRLGKDMDIRTSLDTAAAMECSQMRIWAGSVASCSLGPDERNALADELARVAGIAASYRIILNLEWHKDTLTDTNESGLGILRQVDDPWVRTLWQPTQALSFDERVQGLGMILPYLSYFHVYYWDSTGRRPLREGLDHWKRYFSLPDSGNVYPALLEFVMNDSVEQFLEDAEALRGLIRQAGSEERLNG